MVKIMSVLVGVDNTYDVTSEAELNAAITAIGSGYGIIYLTGSFNLTAAITINIAGSIIIEGMGDNIVITTNGNWKAFNITGAKSVVLKNFSIDATLTTTTTNYTIDINESSDNPILINNISFISTFDSYCIYSVSDNITVCNSRFIGTKSGIWFYGVSYSHVYNNYFYLKLSGGAGIVCNNGCANIVISDNYLSSPSEYNSFTAISLTDASYITITGNVFYNTGGGIYSIGTSANHITVTGNIFYDFDLVAVALNGEYNTISGNVIHTGNRNSSGIGYGIQLGWTGLADYNVISGNLIYNIQNGGTGSGWGIVVRSGCLETTIVGNTILNCKTGLISDSGTNTYQADNNIA